MKFTDIFVRRPVLAIVVNLVIIIAGLQAVRSLNVRQYPRLESATVTVNTVYVGASADLVRGFITTPLERAIAAADGIDYIESQSTQGLSTINVRLKLNFNAASALSDISARVNSVRADLPPEAEIPAINIEPSDSQFAAMYLSFASNILEDNQVTDYLIRIVQPRLSAIPGVQKADILGGRTFAIRAWLKPDRMAALNVSPAQVRQALAANNYLSAVGQTKGALVQVNLTASTDLRSVDEFRRLVVREQNGTLIRLEDIADVVLGADTYDMDVRLSGDKAVFMGVWVLPNANSVDVIKDVNAEIAQIQKELPTGMTAMVAFDSTKYINNAISEVTTTLLETIGIVIIVIFLFLGSFRSVLVPVVAIPVSLIGAVFLMQAFGFTLNLLTLLAVVLSVGLGGRRRHRRRRERRAPRPGGQIQAAGGLHRRARAGRADHRHDHHPGRGLPAHRLPGRSHRRAVPRVRLHPRRRGLHLGCGRADAVADDGVEDAARRPLPGLDGARHRPCLRGHPARLRAGARRDAARARRRLRRLDRHHPADHPDVHVLARRAGPHRGPGRGVRRARRAAQRHPRAARSLPRRGDQGLQVDSRVRVVVPDHVPDHGLRRHVDQAVGRAEAHRVRDPGRAQRQAERHRRGARAGVPAARAAQRRLLPGGVHHRLDGEPRGDAAPRRPDRAGGGQERAVRLPADHRREDRPGQGRDRPRSREDRLDGAQPAAGGPGSVVDDRRQLRQPLHHRQPQLQGDPADRARRAASPPAISTASTSPDRAGSSCRSAPSPPCAPASSRARSTAFSSSTR
jgi:hypothetical protein